MDRSPSGSPSPAKEAMRTNKTRSHPSQTHSPPSTSSTKSTTSNDDSPPEDNSAVVVASEKRQSAPLSRRGHVKSRLGCFSCKRRRVKCNELRPSCSSCRRLGLRCEYPAQAPDISAESGPVTMLTPQAPLTGLKLEDLRFYHQFLTVGHPTLPLQSSWVWSQAAAMSHQVSSYPKFIYTHRSCNLITYSTTSSHMHYSAWVQPTSHKTTPASITRPRRSSTVLLPSSASTRSSTGRNALPKKPMRLWPPSPVSSLSPVSSPTWRA